MKVRGLWRVTVLSLFICFYSFANADAASPVTKEFCLEECLLLSEHRLCTNFFPLIGCAKDCIDAGHIFQCHIPRPCSCAGQSAPAAECEPLGGLGSYNAQAAGDYCEWQDCPEEFRVSQDGRHCSPVLRYE